MNNYKKLMALYITSVICSPMIPAIMQETSIPSSESINITINNIIDDVDSYFMQVLVESRYQTATSVVWVYGCSDKT